MRLGRSVFSRAVTVGVFIYCLAGGDRPVRAQVAPVPATFSVPDDVLFEKGIEFANPDGQHLRLNLARPKGVKGPLPVIVCIHGGGFRAGKRESHDPLLVRFAQRGYVAITVDYRLAPKYQFPAAVHDVKASVRWLRLNARKLDIDPARIGAHGGSAGGHLAQFLGVTADVQRFDGSENPGASSAVAAVVNFWGPSDFPAQYPKSVDAAKVLPLWLGGDLKTALRRHIEASPLYWVTPDAAPTLRVQGTKDVYLDKEQAVWLVDRLRAAQVEAELILVEGAGHGFKGEDALRAEAAMMTFFDRHLKRPR
jgi:acetyl esterase/lipase